MSDGSAMEAIVQRYFRCLDAEDWTEMRELWRDDGRLHAVGARPRAGADAVIGYFSKLFDPWPAHTDVPVRLIVSEPDRTVVAEVLFIGRTADGRDVRFDAVDVFDFVDGRISKLSNWYDIDYARRSLAVTPER